MDRKPILAVRTTRPRFWTGRESAAKIGGSEHRITRIIQGKRETGRLPSACVYDSMKLPVYFMLGEPMIHLEDIHSLTDFQRNAKEHIQRLKETGRPEVLTVNGKAELIVQDAASYQKLLELLDRLEALEGIQTGL